MYYSAQAIPRGSDNFWYTTRKAGACRDKDAGGLWSESIIYSYEFPQLDGPIDTKIGESTFAARRYGELKNGLRLRDRRVQSLQPYYDRLQMEFPSEKQRDGIVYPRFTILEAGSQLDDDAYRLQRESYYKQQVRLDPNRNLINAEKY